MMICITYMLLIHCYFRCYSLCVNSSLGYIQHKNIMSIIVWEILSQRQWHIIIWPWLHLRSWNKFSILQYCKKDNSVQAFDCTITAVYLTDWPIAWGSNRLSVCESDSSLESHTVTYCRCWCICSDLWPPSSCLGQGDPGEMGEAGPSGEPGIPVCICCCGRCVVLIYMNG